MALQLSQFGLSVETVDVDDEDVGGFAGRDRDVEVWIAPPPALDDDWIDRCILAAPGRGR